MVTYWPEVYREMFGIPDTKLIAFGIALGYPAYEARIISARIITKKLKIILYECPFFLDHYTPSFSGNKMTLGVICYNLDQETHRVLTQEDSYELE